MTLTQKSVLAGTRVSVQLCDYFEQSLPVGIAPIAHVQLKRAFFTHLRSSRSSGEMTA